VLAGVTGNQLNPLVAATMFTTMSATSWLEKAQAQVNSDTRLGTGTLVGMSPAFDLTGDVKSITWMPDTGDSKPNSSPLPMSALAGVDRVAFGAFNSQLYLNDYGFIDTTPTGNNQPIATPRGPIPVSFHVFLPKASSNPSAKIPVIIYGHGMGDNQYGAPTFAAATWARKGFATIAMEIPGHGLWPWRLRTGRN
jgi:hypothetical protein